MTRSGEGGGLTTAVERVRALADDLDYAAMPSKPDVVTLCGWSAGQARDALRIILSDHARLSAALGEAREGDDRVGPWLSAAMDDPKVCAAMKTDITAWFESRPVNGEAAR